MSTLGTLILCWKSQSRKGADVDGADFQRALEQAAVRERAGIGTLGEKSVHAVLKAAYEPHPENHEIPIGGYIADIVGEGGVIEIQTRALWRLKEKLAAFLQFCPVTVGNGCWMVRKITGR